MFDVNVAGTASVMKHMMPLVLDSNEKKVRMRVRLSVERVDPDGMMRLLLSTQSLPPSPLRQVIGITTKMASLEEAPTDKPYISAPYRITKAAENM